MNVTIRPALAEDASALPEIERAAGESFRALPDLAWIADGEPMTAGDHLRYIIRGTSWVAQDGPETVGFLSADRAGPELHIVELSVRPESQRRGIGLRLIRAAISHADNEGLTAVTLTTFRDVPWNAPYYARLGFLEVPPLGLSARGAAWRAHESAWGVRAERRCAMELKLSQA